MFDPAERDLDLLSEAAGTAKLLAKSSPQSMGRSSPDPSITFNEPSSIKAVNGTKSGLERLKSKFCLQVDTKDKNDINRDLAMEAPTPFSQGLSSQRQETKPWINEPKGRPSQTQYLDVNTYLKAYNGTEVLE